jgi:acetyl esterase/lipase
MKQLISVLFLLPLTHTLLSQNVIALYEAAIPNSKPGLRKSAEPTLGIFLPEKTKATRTAVIVVPGGGYSSVVLKREGDDVAKFLAGWGITAFVLKYRLPNDTAMLQKEIGPLQDAQRAIQWVRLHAKDYNIDPSKVGIMGFSAGGHLAATLGTHYKKELIPNPQQVSLRPDFMVLAYPVISLTDSLAHLGSRQRLLGNNPSEKLVRLYSNELQVTKKTPPTFLVHAKNDGTVKVANSTIFYDALRKKKVPAEIHLYEKGGHGFDLNNSTSPDKWTDWLKVWMGRWL